MIKKLNESDALKFKTLSPEEKLKKGILGRLFGPVASCVHATRNGRKYSEQLWEKLFNSDIMKERFANHAVFGELNHPDYEEVKMEKVACVMPEPPVKDDNGNLVAYVDILDTPCGRIAYQLAKYGYKFGISSRGTGDLIDGIDGEEVDPDTYQLNAFDLVEIPAVKEARLQFVESLDQNKEGLRQALTEAYSNADEHEKEIMKEALDSFDISDDYYEVHEPEFEEEQEPVEEELEVGDKVKVKVDNNREGEVTEIKGDQVYVELPDDGKNPAREDSYYEQDLEKLDESYETLTSGNFFNNIERIVEDTTPFGVKYINGYSDGLGFDIAFSNCDYDIASDPDWLLDDLKSILKSEYHADDIYSEGDCMLTVTLDEDHPIKELIKEELKEEINGDKSLNELIDDMEESLDENPEDKEGKEVVNDKSDELVAELKESLNKNKTLEADNLSLQEQLSVCNAKEAELREQLARYKQATVKLSDKAKEVKPLKESLNEKDKIIANNKEELKANQVELDSIRESKQSTDLQLKALNESLEDTLKQLEASKRLVENYKKSYRALKESYLETKAYSLGLQTSDVKKSLNESYKIADIDKACQKLYENKLNLNKLPFRLDSSSKISIKEANEYIGNMRQEQSDDYVSPLLMQMIE